MEKGFADESWRKQAACLGTDPNLWVPEKGEASTIEVARLICATCTVKEECLDYALKHWEEKGIWAGTSGRERRIIKSDRLNGKNTG